MTALQITDIGALITALLKGDMFDHFLVKEISIRQAFDVQIDGSVNPSFYSPEEAAGLQMEGYRYTPYRLLRPLCLDVMKGRRKPESFRFVFLLSPENQKKTILHAGSSYQTEDITGMFLHLTYKNETLTCTTGISYRIFSMDKSLEAEWDRLVKLFFRQHGITVQDI